MIETNLYLKALIPVKINGRTDYIMVTEEKEEEFRDGGDLVVDL